MAPPLRTTTVAVAAAAMFAALAVVAHHAGSGTALDHGVLEWLVHRRNPVLTRTAVAITDLGSPFGVVLLAVTAGALWWWRSGSLRPAAVIAVTTLGAGSLSTATKVLVDAQRPASSVQLIVETDPSFPSGHVTGTVALLGSIAVIAARQSRVAVRRLAVAATLLCGVVVALTRVYLGVHWLTDVAGGLTLGGAVALTIYALHARAVPPDDADGPGGASSTNAPSTRATT